MTHIFRWALLIGLLVGSMACSAKDPALAPLNPADLALLDAAYQQGRLAYEAKEYDAAAAQFARVVAADPENLKARVNWGAALSRGGRPLEAISHFQQALSRDPANAEAYFNWGAALARLGRHEEALGKFDQALTLKSGGDMQFSPALRRRLQDYVRRHRSGDPSSNIEMIRPSQQP